MTPSEPAIAPEKESAEQQINKLFEDVLERAGDKGIAASSFGKYDGVREWIASRLGLKDWKRDTYATGASTTAHNFGSRWSQSNQVSGRRVPLGIGFVQVWEAEKTKQKAALQSVIQSVKDTSTKFVDGSRPTSYNSILIFSRLNDEKTVTPQGILAAKGSEIGKDLQKLFPTAEYSELNRVDDTTSTESAAKIASVSTIIKPVASVELGPLLVTSARKDFAEANFQCDEGLIRRVIAALVAKPFVILAGLTGSGKSQLAIAIARWFASSSAQRQVVAVGADWTSNQNLVGYPDALNEDRYISTPSLDLIMRAIANPTLPFFLILDEMNLSHVERYFADLLSSIESGEDIHLHGSSEPKGNFGARISMPKNLFIIGTVNVDETTYMFSPKVLDRANVIEFEVLRSAFASYLNDPRAIDFSLIDGQGDAYAEALVEMATTEPASLSSDDRLRYQAEMMAFFELFDREGSPFAFRTAKEIYRFVGAFRSLCNDDWPFLAAIDAQVLQRLMPKLHGDRARLKRLLMGLGVLCSAKHTWEGGAINQKDLLDSANKFAGSLSDEVPKEWLELQQKVPPEAQLSLSFSKVLRMLTKLRRDGFTTFIEA
jgi:MoxR-like ATPase